MSAKIDLVGRKFGLLKVIRESKRAPNGDIKWKCLCECGVIKSCYSSNLISGNTVSCGCYSRKIFIERSTTHGHTISGNRSLTYIVWTNMIQRCTNPRHKSYKYYGAKGIKVCKRWEDFKNFLEDMKETPGKGYLIDRIENSKGYYKDNCRWVTSLESCNNRTSCVFIEYKNKKQSLKDWCRELGLKYRRTLWRYNQKWSLEEVFNVGA